MGVRYAVVCLSVAAAASARGLLDPLLGNEQPFMAFCAAIAVAAWFGGLSGGLLATALGFFVADYFFLEPRGAFVFQESAPNVAAVVPYLGVGVIISAVAEAMHRARARAERVQTDLEATTAALRQSEERFGLWVQATDSLFWTLGPQAEAVKLHPDCRQFVGLTWEEGQGLGWLQVVHPDDRDRVLAETQRAIREGSMFECKMRVWHAVRSQYLWYLARGVPMRQPDGSIAGWVGGGVNIQKQHEAEAAWRQAREELARANETLEKKVEERTARLRETIAELEHYSYSITHDMRAPLRAMHGFAQLLVRDCGERISETGRDYLRRICTGAARMDKLIQDALNYGLVLRKELPLEPVDVAGLLRGMLESYPNLQAPEADIRLEGDFPLVLGNEAALTQCFSNLLGNAVKFVAPGTQPRVRVRAEAFAGPAAGGSPSRPVPEPRTTNWVRLWVEDNGVGIPDELQEQIFGMFQRLDGGYEGTGIGLAIARKVVERMGGRVGVKSEAGQGSRFWVELRRAESVEKRVETGEPAPSI